MDPDQLLTHRSSYTTLATGSLVVLLIFYVTPSKSEQYSWISLSILLLVDTIIILSVPRIRGEEGWVGIVSVIWATLVSVWAVCESPSQVSGPGSCFRVFGGGKLY